MVGLWGGQRAHDQRNRPHLRWGNCGHLEVLGREIGKHLNNPTADVEPIWRSIYWWWWLHFGGVVSYLVYNEFGRHNNENAREGEEQQTRSWN